MTQNRILRRAFRISELKKMGVSSIDNAAIIVIISDTGWLSKEKEFKESKNTGMPIITLREYNTRTPTLRELENDIAESKNKGAYAHISYAGKEETERLAIERMQLVPKYTTDTFQVIYGWSLKRPLTPTIITALQHNDGIKITAFIGNVYFAGKGLIGNLLAATEIIKHRRPDMSMWALGVPYKVMGDNNRDVRFYPFYDQLFDLHCKPWRQVKSSSERRYIDVDTFKCIAKDHALSEYGRNDLRLKCAGRVITVYELSQGNVTDDELGIHEVITSDGYRSDIEELRIKQLFDEMDSYVAKRIHRNYLEPTWRCIKIQIDSMGAVKLAEISGVDKREAFAILRSSPQLAALTPARVALRLLEENVLTTTRGQQMSDVDYAIALLKEIEIKVSAATE